MFSIILVDSWCIYSKEYHYAVVIRTILLGLPATLEVTGLVTSMPLMDASLVAHLVRKPRLYSGHCQDEEKSWWTCFTGTSCLFKKPSPSITSHWLIDGWNESMIAIVGDDLSLWTFGNHTPEITDAKQAVGQVGIWWIIPKWSEFYILRALGIWNCFQKFQKY